MDLWMGLDNLWKYKLEMENGLIMGTTTKGSLNKARCMDKDIK